MDHLLSCAIVTFILYTVFKNTPLMQLIFGKISQKFPKRLIICHFLVYQMMEIFKTKAPELTRAPLS